MALKLPDSAVPMGDFPVAKAVDIDFDDGENLQEKLDNGTLGGGGGASEAEFVSYDNESLPSVTNVEECLDAIIAKIYYVNPSITSFTYNPSKTTYEMGEKVTSVTFTWTYNKDMVSQTLTGCDLADETVRTATYSTEFNSNKTFTLSASDGKTTVVKSISYRFVNPYYTGVLYTDTPTEENITSLTKKVELEGSKTITYTTSQSYMVFAYPTIYHAISSIIDQNGFNVTDSFTQNIVTVNSVKYYVYISNQCSGSYTMKFNH